MAIIGLLSTTAMVTLNIQRAKARDASRAQQIKALSNVIEIYYLTNNQYPVWTAGGCVNNPGSPLSVLVPDLLNALPKDPKNSDYCYIYKSDTYGQNYRLAAYMENNTDLATKDGGTLSSYFELYSDSSYAVITNSSGILSSWALNGDSTLVGYWKMDEGSWSGASNEAVDSSGYAHHSTAECVGTGCTKPTTTDTGCVFNRCGTFDGTEDSVTTAGYLANLRVRQLTISLWTNRSSGSLVLDRCYYQANVPGYCLAFPSNGVILQLSFACSGASTFAAAYTSTNGLWYHLAATYGDNTVKTYVNGQLIKTDTNGLGEIKYRYDCGQEDYWSVRFARRLSTGYSFYGGKIDETRIYNRPLSACEIYCLCKQGETAAGISCGSAPSGCSCG